MPNITPLPLSACRGRYGETAFRRYEALIAEVLTTAIAGFPVVVHTHLTYNLSNETVASRCRDAARGFASAAWTSTLVDHKKFLELWPKLHILTADDTICIKLANIPVTKPAKIFDQAPPEVLPNITMNIRESDIESLLAVLRLCSEGLLAGVLVTCMPFETIQAYSESYNVAVRHLSTGTLII